VAKELAAYRKGRVGPTTRLLRDGVVELGLSDGSLLDIGGGSAFSRSRIAFSPVNHRAVIV